MKKLLIISIALLPFFTIAQTPFAEKNESVEASLKKVKYDFPKEKINKKNGAGYSLRPELLENPIKKIALVTYFIEDVGMSKENEMVNIAKAWRTSDGLAQIISNNFYDSSIAVLKSNFGASGMELLTPDEFLNTDEKKEYYKTMRIRHSILKKEKTMGASASVSSKSSMPLGGGWVQTSTTTKSASVTRIRVTPQGKGYKPLFFLNESPYTKNYKGDPKPMSLPAIGLYDKKQAQHLGVEMTDKFDVDAVLAVLAVLAVYIVINKMHKKKEIYAVRSITGYMWGANPIQREEGKKGVLYCRGLMFCGARAFYGKGLIIQHPKKHPEMSFEGTNNAMKAIAYRMTNYLTTGKRKMTILENAPNQQPIEQ